MTKRSKKDESFLNDLLGFLKGTPWWVGPLLALFAFFVCRSIVPGFLAAQDPDNPTTQILAPLFGTIVPQLAPLAAIVVLFVWAIAELHKWRDRRRLDSQTGIESIRELNWRAFEQLLAEAFRREGYAVEQLGGAGADGGIDLRLSRAGEKTLVQCKHWKQYKVGVKIVRELLGVMTSERATGGVIVTSGQFTSEAGAFARKVGVRLINGELLVEMVRGVQKNTAPSGSAVMPSRTSQHSNSPECPRCGAEMVLRTARQGANAGSQFWGCSTYPRCRAIVNLAKVD